MSKNTKEKTYKGLISCLAGITALILAHFSITLDTIYNIKINTGDIFPIMIALVWDMPYAILAGVCGGMWGGFISTRSNGCVNFLEAFLFLILLIVLSKYNKQTDETGIEFRFIPIMFLYSVVFFVMLNYGTDSFVKANYFADKWFPFYVTKGISPLVTRIKAINMILYNFAYVIFAKIMLLLFPIRKIFHIKKLSYEKERIFIIGTGILAFVALVAIDIILDSFYVTSRGFRASIFMRNSGELSRLSIFIIVFGLIIYIAIYSLNTMKLSHERAKKKISEWNRNLENMVDKRTKELQISYNELESFSYTVSHELKTPIREIDAYVDIIREDAEGMVSKETMEDLENIQKICKETITMVESMMQYAKAGYSVMKIEEIDMHRLVAECIEELSAGNVHKEIEVNFFQTLPVYGDAFLLKQAVFNILSNSVKFSESKVCISVGSMEDEKNITYYLKDNGVGFELNARSEKKVFDLFDRMHTREKYEGSGVGLTTVKKIMERHGGQVQIFSEKDKGCAVALTFQKSEMIHTDSLQEIKE